MHTKLCTCRTKQITAGFRSYMFFPSSYYALLLKQTKSNKMKSAKQNKIEILSTCFSIQKCRNCCSVIALKQLSPIRLAWDLGLLPKITEGDGEAQGDSKQLRDLLQCNNLLYYCLLKPFVYMPFLAPDCYSYLWLPYDFWCPQQTMYHVLANQFHVQVLPGRYGPSITPHWSGGCS